MACQRYTCVVDTSPHTSHPTSPTITRCTHHTPTHITCSHTHHTPTHITLPTHITPHIHEHFPLQHSPPHTPLTSIPSVCVSSWNYRSCLPFSCAVRGSTLTPSQPSRYTSTSIPSRPYMHPGTLVHKVKSSASPPSLPTHSHCRRRSPRIRCPRLGRSRM